MKQMFCVSPHIEKGENEVSGKIFFKYLDDNAAGNATFTVCYVLLIC